MKKMKTANKIPLLLMLPISAVAIYFIGTNVGDISSRIVDGSRHWLLIFLGVYGVNYVAAWFLKHSWTAAMIRMLACGLFAYIAISELVDVLGGMWGNWHQLLGKDDGALDAKTVSAVRYTVTAWTVGLTMMVVSIAVGFESSDDSVGSGGSD